MGWDKTVRSTQTWTPSDTPTLEFTMTTPSTINQMMGFGKGTLGTSYQNIDFALYASSTYYSIYENGVAGLVTSISPSTSDTLKVTMDSNGLVKYWVNGVVFYTSTQIASGEYYAQYAPKIVGSTTTGKYSFDTWALAYARYDATRGVSCGGWSSVGATDSMDWITIATIGNAADFGNLTAARRNSAGVSSHTRGCMGGGIASSRTNTIDYITIASTGNATDFGDLSTATESNDGVNSDVRGIFGGGHTGAASNTMDYITIDTTGNTTDFGDLTVARANINAVMSEVRGVYGSGSGASVSNMMDYITIATTGNATDFGDLSVARYGGAGLNSVVRGVWAGGEASGFSAVMDYITIATTGNATDFGDLTVARNSIRGGVSSATRGVACGGHTFSNVMDYITIDTTGNATDFGDLMFAKYGVTGVQA